MITKIEAEQKIIEHLNKLSSDRQYKLVLYKELTREEDFGWVFFYNSKLFIETRDPNLALGGNAPFIVDKITGEIYITGTAYKIEHYIESYRRTRIR